MMKAKRLQRCIFVLILVLSCFVFPVFAQEVPEYIEEAAVELRDGIKNWENLITVTFETAPDDFDGTAASARAMADRVLELALAHTGAPDEGDYLRYNIGYMELNSVNFTKQNEGWQITLTYYFAYWTTAEQEAELDAQIESLVQQLELKSDLTDYQKVSAIYHYICENVDYDYENLGDDTYGLKWTTYAAGVQKNAVCQGYSTLFYRLALEAGVDCRVVVGYAGENHSWNIVKLDGYYYNVDSTWDAEGYDLRFFLKSAAEFIGHDPDPEYETPEFLAAYPPAEKSYELPNMENARDGDFEYRVMGGLAALLQYHGTERDVVVPAMLGGYPVYWIGSCAFSHNSEIVSITFSEGIRVIESEAILECRNLKSIHLPSTADFTASKEPDFQCRVICGASHCPAVETITVAEGNPNLVVVDNVLYNREMTILRYYPAGDPREAFDIPEGVISIGAGAFAYGGNLKEVNMPDTVLRVQMDAFAYCAQLEKIHISDSCHFIDQFCFSGTALKAIHIPASVKSLYAGTFGVGSVVETITVDPANPVYYLADGVLYGRYSEDCNADSCHLPGDWLVKYPAGREETSFTVPEGIVGIEQHAFDCGENLTEILLPDGLQVLFSCAFWGCSGLTKLELPDSLEKIENGALEDCTGLVKLVIPAGVEYLGYYILPSEGSLENIVFLGDAPEMSDQTFAWQTVNVYYPAGNTTWEAVKQMYAHESGVRWIEACKTHQFVSKTREATCVLAGYVDRECSVCGMLEGSGEVIPPTGHDLVLDCVQEPGCEYSGFTVYYCAVCGAYITEDEVAPLGHSYDENGICAGCVAKDAPNLTNGGSLTDPLSQQDIITICAAAGGVILAVVVIMLLLLKKPTKE